MALENIVRAHQLPRNTLPSRIESPAERDAPIVRLAIGLGGAGKVMMGAWSFAETFYCTAYQVEKRNV